MENFVRCKYFEASVHTKNPIENSYQDDLCRTTQTLDHILIRDERKSQINEYSDYSWQRIERVGRMYGVIGLPRSVKYVSMIGENRQIVTNEPVEFEK